MVSQRPGMLAVLLSRSTDGMQVLQLGHWQHRNGKARKQLLKLKPITQPVR
jgi:hypothetical protein